MITSRSQYSASSMKCVVTSTVTPAFRQRIDALPEFAPGQRIDAGGGFVEKQDVRFVHQRTGQRQTLLVAERQVARGGVEHRAEIELGPAQSMRVRWRAPESR